MIYALDLTEHAQILSKNFWIVYPNFAVGLQQDTEDYQPIHIKTDHKAHNLIFRLENDIGYLDVPCKPEDIIIQREL